MSSSYGYGAKA